MIASFKIRHGRRNGNKTDCYDAAGGFQKSAEKGLPSPAAAAVSSCMAPKVGGMPDTERADRALLTVSMGSPPPHDFRRVGDDEVVVVVVGAAVVVGIKYDAAVVELAMSMFSS